MADSIQNDHSSQGGDIQCPTPPAGRGVAYGPGVTGKYRFRVRVLHVAETYVPLLKAKKLGAVKLDLVLRGVAYSPSMPATANPDSYYPISTTDPSRTYADPRAVLNETLEDAINNRKTLRLKRNRVSKQHGGERRPMVRYHATKIALDLGIGYSV